MVIRVGQMKYFHVRYGKWMDVHCSNLDEFHLFLIMYCFFRWKYMKNGLVCQLDFGHKIWGAVSVVMEGVYRVGQSFGG